MAAKRGEQETRREVDDAVSQVAGVSIYTGLDLNREDWPDMPIIREKKADR
jgi:hypothetical protein